MSNTKVTSFGFSKSEVWELVDGFMIQNPESSFHYNKTDGVTVLVTQEYDGCYIMRVSTAIMSADENKFRKSVGRFITVENMEKGQYINVPSYMIEFVLESLGVM